MVSDSIRGLLERVFDTALVSFQSWQQFCDAIGNIPKVFVNLASNLAWPYVLSSLIVAWLLYLAARCQGAPVTFREFAFPARLYRHPSTFLDVRFMLIDLVVSFLFYVPVYTGIGLVGTKIVSVLLVDTMGWQPPRAMTPFTIICTTIGFVLLFDFITYVTHVWMHRSPCLWSFHQVHHSAEVLTPAVVFRVHPVENMLVVLMRAPVLGLVATTYQHLIGREREFILVGGVTVFGVALQLLGSHLRHSHLWWSFGPRLNRWLISPAHHQLHHSIESRHWNRNFGEKFAIWDRLFGTLYVPRAQETFQVGLPAGASVQYRSLADLYLRPFLLLFVRWKEFRPHKLVTFAR